MKLHPHYCTASRRGELAAAWAERPHLRLEQIMEPGAIGVLAHQVSTLPFRLRAEPYHTLPKQYFEYPVTPSQPALGSAVRWVLGPLRDLVSHVCGRTLAPPPEDQVFASLYTLGCYLDPHNDWDGRRAVAWVLGLTRVPWPQADGGWHEVLDVQGDQVVTVDARPPGWNTLDLFDVYEQPPLHQVSMLTKRHDRFALTGWFYLPE